MKKISILLAFLSFSLGVMAQNSFLNQGFESWTGNMPNNWNSLNISSLNLCDISKSTSSHSGNYAVGIAAKPISPLVAQALNTLLGIEIPSGTIIPGILTNATLNPLGLAGLLDSTSDMDPSVFLNLLQNGLALTSKPLSVDGYYSWNSPDESKEYFSLIAFATATVNQERTIIGFGFYPFDFMKNQSKSTYTNFSLPINYVSNDAPEELIFIAMVNSDSTSTVFTKLLLDDLTITSDVGISNLELNSSQKHIFPNPSNGSFKLNANNCSYCIVNSYGQVIKNWENYSENKELSIENPGVYFIRIKKNDRIYTEKLIIN